jgi:hypothetical protein
MTTAHRVRIGLALTLALAGSAAPAAARHFDVNANGTEVLTGSPANLSNAIRSSRPVGPPATIVRVTTSDSSFDWGDAAIGAAGGFALSMIAVGGAVATTQRRDRHTHGTARVS